MSNRFICWLLHKKEEMLEGHYEWDCQYKKWILKWGPFKHCVKCHRPLLDLNKTYTTADELESKVRAKILERQLQENV